MPPATSTDKSAGRDVADAAVGHREHDGEQRAHRDAEREHAEAHADVGLHAPGEDLGAVLVGVRRAMASWAARDAVLEVDRPLDDRVRRRSVRRRMRALQQGRRPEGRARLSAFPLCWLLPDVSGRGSRGGGERRARTRARTCRCRTSTSRPGRCRRSSSTSSARNAVSDSHIAALAADRSTAGATLWRASEWSCRFLSGFRVPCPEVATGVGSDCPQWRDRSGFSPDSFARRLQQHPNQRV